MMKVYSVSVIVYIKDEAGVFAMTSVQIFFLFV